MKVTSTTRIVFAALFAALCCTATLVIRVPSPTGYINLGDCFVLMSAFVLGPVYGAAAAGIGSALADILCGYTVYAPATLIIKALMALVSGLIFRTLSGRTKNSLSIIPCLVCGIAAEIIMVAGYYAFESLIMGYGVAAVESIPGNIFQGIFGIVLSTLLTTVLLKIKYINPIIRGLQNGKSTQQTH